MSDLLAWRSLS